MADAKTILMPILGVVIGLVVILSLLGGMAITLRDSSRALTQGNNNCSLFSEPAGAAYVFNYTSENCENASNSVIIAKASQQDLPLEGLFAPTGVVLVILMISLFVMLLIMILKGKVKLG